MGIGHGARCPATYSFGRQRAGINARVKPLTKDLAPAPGFYVGHIVNHNDMTKAQRCQKRRFECGKNVPASPGPRKTAGQRKPKPARRDTRHTHYSLEARVTKASAPTRTTKPRVPAFQRHRRYRKSVLRAAAAGGIFLTGKVGSGAT